MSPYGVKMLLLLFTTFLDTAGATDCSSYNSSGKFEIPENKECTLSSDLSVSKVTVYGTMKIISANLVTLQAQTIDIKPGAKISADAVAGKGLGQGNSQGSGGAFDVGDAAPTLAPTMPAIKCEPQPDAYIVTMETSSTSDPPKPTLPRGYGGRGGSPANMFLSSWESLAYGNAAYPNSTGSPGGGSSGGMGGGAIFLKATGNIEVNGILSVNGGDASGTFGGGGSGGSIYLDASTIRGSGMITARGGDGVGNGGGGGGGRIMLKHDTLASTAEVYADGGLGGNTESLLRYSSMTASSSEHNYGAAYGYIGYHSTNLWRPNRGSYSGAYLEMTLNADYYVTAIQTKGGSSYYVTSFTIRYFNTSAVIWQSIGDENYVFGSSRSSVTTAKLPGPVYTSKIRLYPKTWISGIEVAFKVYGYSKGPVTVAAGICTPATEGGPGGPGTVYFRKTNSPSTLVVNNFGKNTHIRMDKSCQNMDVVNQGAVAFLSDTVHDLRDLMIYDGSHVVFESNQVVTNVFGAGGSMIHILNDTTLDINGKITADADVKAGSKLRLFAIPTVEIVSTVKVNGSFDLIYPDKQSLVMISPASVTIN